MERAVIKLAKIESGVLNVEQNGEYYPADDVLKLSAGIADSAGVCVVGAGVAFYIVNTQPDTQNVINQLIETCNKLVAVCNTVATTGAPLNPAVGLEVQEIITELQATELL